MVGELHTEIVTGKKKEYLAFRYVVKLIAALPWPLPTPPLPPPPPIHHLENQLQHQRRNTNVNSAIVPLAEASIAAGMSDRVSLEFFVCCVGQMFTAPDGGVIHIFRLLIFPSMQIPKNDHSNVQSAAVHSSVVTFFFDMIEPSMQKMAESLSSPRVGKEGQSRHQQRDHQSHQSTLIQRRWSRLRQAVMVWSILKLPPC